MTQTNSTLSNLTAIILAVGLGIALAACANKNVPAGEQATREQNAWIAIKNGALVVDVRTPEEFERGHLEGALNIPYDQIELRSSELGGDKKRVIMLYCRSGRRSGIAEQTLIRLGFRNAFNGGGYEALLRARR